MAGGEGKLKNHGFLCVFMGCFSEISMKYGHNGTTDNQLYPYNDISTKQVCRNVVVGVLLLQFPK
jgi:hypothetical protein